MRIDELVGREKKNLTKKEREYLLSCDVIKTTRLVRESEVIEIGYFVDGSYTKTVCTEENDWNGDEVASSEEELNKLTNSGDYKTEVLEYSF